MIALVDSEVWGIAGPLLWLVLGAAGVLAAVTFVLLTFAWPVDDEPDDLEDLFDFPRSS